MTDVVSMIEHLGSLSRKEPSFWSCTPRKPPGRKTDGKSFKRVRQTCATKIMHGMLHNSSADVVRWGPQESRQGCIHSLHSLDLLYHMHVGEEVGRGSKLSHTTHGYRANQSHTLPSALHGMELFALGKLLYGLQARGVKRTQYGVGILHSRVGQKGARAKFRSLCRTVGILLATKLLTFEKLNSQIPQRYTHRLHLPIAYRKLRLVMHPFPSKFLSWWSVDTSICSSESFSWIRIE